MKQHTTTFRRLASFLSLLLLLSVQGNEVWGIKPDKETIIRLLKQARSGYTLLECFGNDEDACYDAITTLQDVRWDNVSDITWDNIQFPPTLAQEWPSDETAANGITLQPYTTANSGNDRTVIYAAAGEVKTLTFQVEAGDNIDGFLWWYGTTDLDNGTKTSADLQWATTKGNAKYTFTNGIAWLRTFTAPTSYKLCLNYDPNSGSFSINTGWTGWGDGRTGNYDSVGGAAKYASQVNYTVPSNAAAGSVYYVVLEASSSNHTTKGSDENSIQTPEIAVKSVYEIHVINTQRVKTTGTNSTLALTAEMIADPENTFVEYFDIHVPKGRAVNFRLSEALANYYVPSGTVIASPTQIRWQKYSQAGTTQMGTEAIQSMTFTEADGSLCYLVAEVSSDSYTWYPVSLLTVHLEDKAEPKLASELSGDYEFRSERYLLAHHFEEIEDASIRFDRDKVIAGSTVNIANNFYPSVPPNLETTYAFADLAQYYYRNKWRMSVGRGEYALYRTLNYPHISTSFDVYQAGFGGNGQYNDWFAGNGYNRRVVDRRWEETNGAESGYFFYVDAADEPGVITRIPVSGLCPNTSLIVTAWVCNLNVGGCDADVGITIKRQKTGGSEEVITRYYSGSVENRDDGTTAYWQQIYFKVAFEDGDITDQYYVELSNNCESSSGADYGIDDIRIYKSTPDITVNRKMDCSISELVVTTPFETLLNNMLWQEIDEGETITSGSTDFYKDFYFSFLEDVTGSLQLVNINKTASTYVKQHAYKVRVYLKRSLNTGSKANEDTSSNDVDAYAKLDTDGETLLLATIDVKNTDLQHFGQPTDDNGHFADGRYKIWLFKSEAVAGETLNPPTNPQCEQIADFVVKGNVMVQISMTTTTQAALCAGSLRKVTAKMLAYDEYDNPVVLDPDDYILDWYLGTEDDYSALGTPSPAVVLYVYRSENNYMGSITAADAAAWNAANPGYAEKLREWIQKGLLLTGTQPDESFLMRIPGKEIVALPYIKSGTQGDVTYCALPTYIPIPEGASDQPKINYGFGTGDGNVPLRLGLRHTKGTLEQIPISSNNIVMVNGAASLGANNMAIYLQTIDGAETIVGTANMNAQRQAGGTAIAGYLSIGWDATFSGFTEGESYTLLIPFAQYDASGNVLNEQCDGVASLMLKIVPEYLTWQGDGASDAWYNDANWHQSTKGELFFEGTTDEDANGSDEVTKAFAPLYFTKITIPESKQLSLETAIPDENEIKHEMAVDKEGDNLTIVPYYINKVDEIYFKPNATLMNQHLLTYNKAWVEFRLQKDQPNWMASPLHATYAGDFYAPIRGSQDTPAFTDITYDSNVNSRWGLPFYQKAWSKGVAYSLNADASSVADIKAVQSNWSIEYNDVWVPNTVGKGFYLRYGEGEESIPQVKLRLPKADTSYGYETLRAGLSPAPENRTNAYRLAGTQADENGVVTFNLTEVDGDGTHYLIGNPYMTYLDMAKFFEANTDLAKKYWTLSAGNATEAHVVGTPDVTFDDKAEGYVAGTGIVAPMQAFFVELLSTPSGQAEGEGEGTEPPAAQTLPTITFKPEMMAASATASPAEGEVQTTAFAAVNPLITLTATRGELQSHATLLAADGADDGYVATEDAVALIDSELDAPIVYSVAGSQAAQVNAVKELLNVGLGVYVKGDEEVTLTLSGLDRFAVPLSLYDAETHKSQRLEGDSFRLTLRGSSHGRYFLRSELATDAEAIAAQSITIYSAEPSKVIIDALQPIRHIRVFRINGAQERDWEVNSTHQMLHLPAGLYLIHVSDGTTEQVEKVVVR